MFLVIPEGTPLPEPVAAWLAHHEIERPGDLHVIDTIRRDAYVLTHFANPDELQRCADFVRARLTPPAGDTTP